MTLIDQPTIRRVALIARAKSGKSTFAAANARGEVMAFDADHNLDNVRNLFSGKVHLANKRTIVDTLLLSQEIERAAFDLEVQTIIFDSVTRYYRRHARAASVASRLPEGERVSRGFQKNKAANLIGKADTIVFLSDAASYGTDVYYIWHQQESIDVGSSSGSYDKIIKDTISEKEKDILMASVNIVLVLDYNPGNQRYSATVAEARDFGGRKVNSGFTVTDFEGNFWRDGLDRVLDRVYVNFKGQDEALAWAATKLGTEPAKLLDWYTQVKDTHKPRSAGDMWAVWIEAVYRRLWENRNAKPANGAAAPAEVAVKQVAQPAPVIEQVAADDFDEQFPPRSQPETAPPAVTEGQRFYGDNAPVDEADWELFDKYVAKFGRQPYSDEIFQQAVVTNHEGWAS